MNEEESTTAHGHRRSYGLGRPLSEQRARIDGKHLRDMTIDEAQALYSHDPERWRKERQEWLGLREDES